MRQMQRLFAIACLVIAGIGVIGCKRMDEPRVITFTASVSLNEGLPDSKALTSKGVKTFAVGERIAIVYTNKSNQTVKAVSAPFTSGSIREGGKRADITVTLSNPKAGGAVTYIYPAAMSKADGSVNYDALATQDGTLATLAASLDLATYSGTLTGDAKLPAFVTLSNQLAIGEFTIKNADGTHEFTADVTRLIVSDGSNTYTVTPASSFGAGPVYVAMRPVGSGKTINFTATVGGYDLVKSVSGQTLVAGGMYPVGLRFGSVIDLSKVTTRDSNDKLYYAAKSGDIITGKFTGGRGYVTVDDGAAITLRGVDYTTPVYGNHAAIHCLGNAGITLEAGSSNKVYACGLSPWPSVYVPADKTVTISGTGELLADASESSGAGIGGGNLIACGNIVISGGVITALSGSYSAGIGSGSSAACGNITISGGVIKEAKRGSSSLNRGAGIGSAWNGSCGNILISGGQIGGTIGSKVYDGAKGGENAAGIGCGYSGSCGAITIGEGIVYIRAAKGTGSNYHIGGPQLQRGTVTVDGEILNDTQLRSGKANFTHIETDFNDSYWNFYAKSGHSL